MPFVVIDFCVVRIIPLASLFSTGESQMLAVEGDAEQSHRLLLMAPVKQARLRTSKSIQEVDLHKSFRLMDVYQEEDSQPISTKCW